MLKMPPFERLSQKIQGNALEHVFLLEKNPMHMRALLEILWCHSSSGYILALCPQRFDRFEFEILL